jgi:thymidine phosphorylase
VVKLGGGRSRADQKIDHAVGLDKIVKPGEPIKAGEPLLYVHVQSQAQFDQVEQMLRDAIVIAEQPCESLTPVFETISA